MTILQKFSGDTRIYSVDFAAISEIATDAQTLSSGSVTVTPDDLTIGSVVVSGTKLKFSVSGGDISATYHLLVTAVLSGGSHYLECVPIEILEC